jgi:UrcA family protein
MKAMVAKSIAATVVCTLFQVLNPAYADSRSSAADRAHGIRINVEHLDLESPEVAFRIYARIEKSAWLLCRDATSPWDGAPISTLKRCVSAAIDDAVKQANSPRLTALHQSKKQRGDLVQLTR